MGRRHAPLCKQATDILRSIGRELTEDASRCRLVCVLMGILEDLCESNVEDMVPPEDKGHRGGAAAAVPALACLPDDGRCAVDDVADHFPVWTKVIEVAKCWVFMTKTLQEQLTNVLLVTAAHEVDNALTIDDETVTMSGTWSRSPTSCLS